MFLSADLPIEIAKQLEGKSDRFLLTVVVCFAMLFLTGMVLRMELYTREQMKLAREQSERLIEALTRATAMLERLESRLESEDHGGHRRK
jgi:hypothetical protein